MGQALQSLDTLLALYDIWNKKSILQCRIKFVGIKVYTLC